GEGPFVNTVNFAEGTEIVSADVRGVKLWRTQNCEILTALPQEIGSVTAYSDSVPGSSAAGPVVSNLGSDPDDPVSTGSGGAALSNSGSPAPISGGAGTISAGGGGVTERIRPRII